MFNKLVIFFLFLIFFYLDLYFQWFLVAMDKSSALDYINQMFPTGSALSPCLNAWYSGSVHFMKISFSLKCNVWLIFSETLKICESRLVKRVYLHIALFSVYRINFVRCGRYSEASLSGVEPLMQKIHSEIRRVDAGILAAVRQQVKISYLSVS